MHDVVENFILEKRVRYPFLFSEKRVLEFGSFDINGGVRVYFTDCEYTGLDWREGPGVNVVSLMHEFQSETPYDFIITTSALEHDPYWKESLRRCLELLKSGGSLLVTCGGPSYEEHCLETAPPVEEKPGLRHYAGVSAMEIRAQAADFCGFEVIEDESDERDVRLLFHRKT